MRSATRRENGAGLIPERLLQFAIAGTEALPRYLLPADHVWLRILIEEFRRFDGKRLDELHERLREPLPCYAPEGKAKLAMHVLERLCHVARPASPISPRLARRALFSEAQQARTRSEAWDRTRVLEAAASGLGLSPEALLRSLFADLPSERIVDLPSPPSDPHELARRANLALAQGFLHRSSRVTLVLRGNARAVVRQVQLRRLLCSVRPRTGPGRATIEISGPYSLFKRTILYGRALSSLVPVLRECDQFHLRADAVLRARELSVVLQSGDPIFPAGELSRRYDSKLEERFALEFLKAAPDFDLVREPEPLRAGDHLIFPDFAIYRRRDPSRRVLLEIVGFWTPRYLREKLGRLRAMRATDLILCVDDSLNCTDEDLADAGHVVRFKRRIDVVNVLAMVEMVLQRRHSRLPQGSDHPIES
jgi:predicted nuclease of restriction endonuclease-like RecB superfamily